jgi:hypothetical protein
MKLTFPHWVGIALAVAAIVIAQVMAAQASGQLLIPAEALTVLVIVSKVISLLNVSINPAANTRAALATGDVVPATIGEREDMKIAATRNEVTMPDVGATRKP